MANTKNVHQRLAAAMGDIGYIQKERKQGMNYTIVSHDVVTAKVRPILLKHGIVYYPVRCEHLHNGNRAECSMTVRFVNVDEPSDFFDVPTFGYGIDPQDKGPGKAMSYAVKYALLKALGLETGDEPDAESIDHSRVDPHVPAKAEAPKEPQKNDAARTLYSNLQKQMRGLKTSKDLAEWWGDQDCRNLRASLPSDWLKALTEECAKQGRELKASEANLHPRGTDKDVATIKEAFPGARINNETITDGSGRDLSNMEAGEWVAAV